MLILSSSTFTCNQNIVSVNADVLETLKRVVHGPLNSADVMHSGVLEKAFVCVNDKIILKLEPQIFTEPSFLVTATIGDAHCENCLGLMIPSLSSRSNSASTLSFTAYGMGRGKWKDGGTFGCMWSSALAHVIVPSSLLKTDFSVANTTAKSAASQN